MNKYEKIFSVKNLKIFVFGGCGLIGSEISKSLIDLEARVTVFDIQLNKNTKKNSFKFVKLSNSNIKNIEKFFRNYLKVNDCPDVFINASYPATKDWKKNTFKEITYSSYKKNIEIHLHSYVWLAKIIADKMKKNKVSGSIIQLSSIYGLVAQDGNLYENTNLSENMTYGVIKSSVIHFTKQLASYYGKNNIRVNNVIIGGVSGHIKGSKQKQDLNFLKKFKKKVPMQRMANASEIVAGIIFLASDSSSYITGSNLVIDGGYTIL